MSEYRFKHFTMRVLVNDMRFSNAALKVGDSLPKVDLPTLSSEERFTTKEGVMQRPLLLITGSITCPMTASAMPLLKKVHRQFGNQINFVMLNVREAHPGENFPQPESDEEKLDHARAFRDRYDIPWTVAVDDIDGALHQALDGKPNNAYLVDTNGDVVFRSLWSSDERGIRQALESVSRGELPGMTQSTAMLRPLVTALAHVWDVMNLAGPQARRDLLLGAPPMALIGWIASLIRA